MYVRVYRKDDQWFRVDNRSLVGKEIFDTDSFFCKTQHIIETNTGRYYKPIKGYFNGEKFIPLCQAGCNFSNCQYNNSAFCFCSHKDDNSAGYYIFTD